MRCARGKGVSHHFGRMLGHRLPTDQSHYPRVVCSLQQQAADSDTKCERV